MKCKISKDFFLWFCHWGIYDKKEEQQRVAEAFECIMGESCIGKTPRRGETAEHNRKAGKK